MGLAVKGLAVLGARERAVEAAGAQVLVAAERDVAGAQARAVGRKRLLVARLSAVSASHRRGA